MPKTVDVVVYTVENGDLDENFQKTSKYVGHVVLKSQTDDFQGDLEAAHRQLDHLIKEARSS
jgi:aminoglycoside phosphotransferase family enzyme